MVLLSHPPSSWNFSDEYWVAYLICIISRQTVTNGLIFLMHYLRFYESSLGGFTEGEKKSYLSISRVKISWVHLCTWGISAKNDELARIVIAKNDFKPHGSFSANWMMFSTLRVWGIAVSVVGTHFPNDLYCHLTLIKSGGVCGIIVLAAWKSSF